MEKESIYNIFLTLGLIWVIGGLVIFQNSSIWPLGFIFLVIGFIGKAGGRKSKEE